MQDKSRRCDRCGAEAWVSVKKSELVLDFCAHDYNANSTLLHAEGWSIAEDERYLINEKPSVSANV